MLFITRQKCIGSALALMVAAVVPLVASAQTVAPSPSKAPAGLAACGSRPDPVAHRFECVQQVAQRSANWKPCEAGDEVACHRFVRDVVRALAAGDSRWGLITKPRGQQSCTTTECGPHVGGFGGDVVAYLPEGHTPQQWLGTDIVGGAGAPGARQQWSTYDGYTSNRPDNLWVKLPK